MVFRGTGTIGNQVVINGIFDVNNYTDVVSRNRHD